jgi:hypothetical protein
MPQHAYMRQYAASTAFIWQQLPPEPQYRHESLRLAHTAFAADRNQFNRVSDAVTFCVTKLRILGSFYVGPVLLLPLLFFPWLMRGRLRAPLLMATANVAAILVTAPFQVHYGSPAAACIFISAAGALRLLWAGRGRGYRVGGFLAPGASAVVLLAVPLAIWTSGGQINPFPERAATLRELERVPGSHLVFVRYEEIQRVAREWVYNGADIDAATVVWARDMGDQANRQLIDYYGGKRRVWLLVPRANSASLTLLGP